MSQISYTSGGTKKWEIVSENIEKLVLRAEPGENRILLRIGKGGAFPKHAHSVPDEVFVVEGTYVDPGVEGGKEFGPGSYLYYPAGTEHNATSPTGCTILVWNSNVRK
jgi:anti-sigma factor ChrR (cupin superfamily)